MYDLHTHSNASDGALDPLELVAAAAERGIRTLAITDHDTLAGFTRASLPGEQALRLIPGIEFSVRWRRQTLHLVGLAFRPADPRLTALIAAQQERRRERAGRIAERLERAVGTNLLDDATALANSDVPGRAHFARALVASGRVPDLRRAFRRYLGAGKTGDVHCDWVALAEAIQTIRDADGIAVLAHPSAYGFGKMKLGELVTEFADVGGAAIEVISGRQSADLTAQLAKLATERGLAASVGSDFHGFEQAHRPLGNITPLPSALTPVWSLPAFGTP